MPYIAVKAYPKDEATKQKVAEKINQIFLEEWGCPPQALSISFEEISPEDWDKKIRKLEMEPNKEKMMILDGEKLYK